MKKKFGHFIIQKEQVISEINATLIELKHAKMGSDVIAIINDDDENVFNISFSTFPQNSRGTAHVLEHIVLCGSENFPVRDPFFAMTRRSMNTFMNALTGADFTCYPAASQIPHDFYNLLKVYLDAVFHPRLLIESFWQEGIHFGFDANGFLTIKGIVYNEMKGAMSTPDSRLHEILYENLLPNLPYHFNSGGNPNKIRELTYDEVKTFHKEYYHPSRAVYYFYGNLPLEKHLDFLEEHAFQGVEPLAPLPKLSKQPRFTHKKKVQGAYPFSGEEEKKEKILFAIGYLTAPILNQEELLALHVLDLALMGTDAAPLKSAILKSNLCKQVDSNLDDEMSEVPYTFVCKGCKESTVSQISLLIHENLFQLAKEGISSHLIEGALHQLELARTEISGHSFPYGLSLFFRSALLKQHGGSPQDGLMVHTLFRKLRDKFADPNYFPYLINKYLLQNPHCVEVVMIPQSDLSQKEAEEEKEYIQSIATRMDADDKKLIKEKEKKLLFYQEDEGDLEILPCLTLADVPKEGKDFQLRHESQDFLDLYQHNCFTNDFLYTSLFFDLPQLEEKDLAYLHLFTIFAPELGCGNRNYKENLDYIFQYTGGIHLDLDLFVSCTDPQVMRPALSLKGKALHRHAEQLFTLYQDMFFHIDFSDVNRLKELSKQHKEALENSIVKHPLRYALGMATSSIYKPLYFQYLWQGFSYFEKAVKIINDFFIHPDDLIRKMEEIQEKVLSLKKADLVMSIPDDMYSDIKGLLNIKPAKRFSSNSFRHEDLFLTSIPAQGRVISAPVSFTAFAFKTVPYVDMRSPALSVAAEIMENKVLHKRIREQGGAYGAGASHSATFGYFYFHSYRDPHLKMTVDAFHEAVRAVVSGHFDQRDVDEAKLCILQVHDAPVFPEHRAIVGYTWQQCGRHKELRQIYRERLMALTKEEIQRAAEEILLSGLAQGTLIIFAGKELFEKEQAFLKERDLPLFNI